MIKLIHYILHIVHSSLMHMYTLEVHVHGKYWIIGLTFEKQLEPTSDRLSSSTCYVADLEVEVLQTQNMETHQ